MDGPAPAIINAVVAATGEEFRSIPLLPEDIFAVLSNPQRETEAIPNER
jgi:CO/xanthine dehydrogenase Mo-binding subunit